MSLPHAIVVERYQDALPAVAVRVGGQARTFLLDTGAGVSCVTPALAAELGATPYGRLVGLRMTGDRQELQRVDGVTLALGEVELAPPTVGVLDLDPLLPEGWPPVDGVLALDAFVAQPFTLDLAARALVLEASDSLAARIRVGEELEIRVARPLQGHGREVFVAAHLDDRTWWLELDSGNAAPVLLAEHTGLEADGEITLDLGGAPWTGVFHLQPMILDGNLGQTFLAGRAVTLDLAAERMWAAPSAADG